MERLAFGTTVSDEQGIRGARAEPRASSGAGVLRVSFVGVVLVSSACGGRSDDSNPVDSGHGGENGLIPLGEPCSLGPDRLSSETGTAAPGPPAIAPNGEGFGVAWYEARDFADSGLYFGGLDAASALVDTPRLIVEAGPKPAPGLSGDRDDYALAWWIESGSGSDGVPRGGVYFTPVDPYGERTGEDVLLSESETSAVEPGIVRMEDRFAVHWSAPESAPPGMFLSIVSDGRGTEPTRLALPSGAFIDPRVVSTGNELALVWAERRGDALGIYFAELDADGSPLAPETRISAASCRECSNPMIAWTGSGYGVAWLEYVADGDSKVHFQRLARGGSPLGEGIVWPGYPSGLAFDGEIFRVLYANELVSPLAVFLVEIEASNVTAHRPILGIEPSPNASGVAFAARDTVAAVAWQAPGFQIFAGGLDCP